jgi:hypothetical protein
MDSLLSRRQLAKLGAGLVVSGIATNPLKGAISASRRRPPIPYWSAKFESGPSNGIDKYSGYEDWSFVQAEEPDQANPALSGVVLASDYGFAAHSGQCVGMFRTDHTAWLANLYHSKVYKQFQFAGSTTIVDVFGRNLQAAPNNSINGTYRCWYYAQAGFQWAGGANIFQWKLDEQDPFRQNAEWWIAICTVGDLGNPSQPALRIENWPSGGSYLSPSEYKVLPTGSWFEIRADLWEGDKIDWYFNGVFWKTSLASQHHIGRSYAVGTPRSWVFGAGHYGEGGPLFIDDASFTPF